MLFDLYNSPSESTKIFIDSQFAMRFDCVQVQRCSAVHENEISEMTRLLAKIQQNTTRLFLYIQAYTTRCKQM